MCIKNSSYVCLCVRYASVIWSEMFRQGLCTCIIYIAHKQTCLHIHTQSGIRGVCVMNMCTSRRLNYVGLCQKQFKRKTENHWRNLIWLPLCFDIALYGVYFLYILLWNHSENVAQEHRQCRCNNWSTEWYVHGLLDWWLIDWMIEPQKKCYLCHFMH